MDSLISRCTGCPRASNTRTSRRVISATSPSSRYIKRRVTLSSASWSDARKFSPIPKPITIGLPERATTKREGSLRSITTVP
ncbi:Uncharacterised protein [Vibrio cholerae]|nr:Uncharacterised protein [Vibrio cholerae]